MAAVLTGFPAQALDNPDILDVPGVFREASSSTPDGAWREFSFQSVHETSPLFAYGGLSRQATMGVALLDWVRITAEIYEPDSMRRKAAKSSLFQKTYVAIKFTGWHEQGGGSFYYAALAVPSCKAKAVSTSTEGKVAVSCKATAWNDLLLPAPKVEFVRELLGLKKIKFTVKLP